MANLQGMAGFELTRKDPKRAFPATLPAVWVRIQRFCEAGSGQGMELCQAEARVACLWTCPCALPPSAPTGLGWRPSLLGCEACWPHQRKPAAARGLAAGR